MKTTRPCKDPKMQEREHVPFVSPRVFQKIVNLKGIKERRKIGNKPLK